MNEEELDERAEAQVSTLDQESLNDGLSLEDYAEYLCVLIAALRNRLSAVREEIELQD